MANKIILKKSSVANKTPLTSDLDYGELALNYADGRLYFKDSGNVIQRFNATIIASTTTTSTTQITLASFATATYGSAEFSIQATQGTARHLTKLLVTHDGTTAIATEYGVLTTASSLFTVDVDISTGSVRLRITPTSATSTSFKTVYTLIEV